MSDWGEICFFKMNIDTKCIWSGALLYRPPKNKAHFANKLLELIAPHVVAADNFFILGDFNHHAELSNDHYTATLTSSMCTLGLEQIVYGATHMAGHTLDLLFTNSSSIKFESSNQVIWSDHHISAFSLGMIYPLQELHMKRSQSRTWANITPASVAAHFSLPPFPTAQI